LRIYPFFIPHAGCPHRCSFCRQDQVSGRLFPPDPSALTTQLEAMLSGQGGGEVAFYGGSFTSLPLEVQDAYLNAAAPSLAAGGIDGIRVSARPDALGEKEVSFLQERGVTTVEVGVQSFSPEVLRRAEQGHDSQAVFQAVLHLRRAGMKTGLQLMPGLPGGDRAEALCSLASALALNPDFLRVYPTVVLRGTPLAEEYFAGRFQPLTLAAAVALCAEMAWRCRRRKVPVIRWGLHNQPELTADGALLSGPWHPAFGQLVRAHLWLRALFALAAKGEREAAVPIAEFSGAQGHRRNNLCSLRKRYPDFVLRAESDLAPHTLRSAAGQVSLWSLSAYSPEELVI
jgi:histone acetyltransferase (RNA polymerase elongator complex component)